MVSNIHLHTIAAEQPVAVSCAGGGMPQQYRVQYHPQHQELWRMYASFRTQDEAQQCVEELKERGYAVRVVRYAICPSAA